ncbi:MAG: acylase [Saprospiraceae bacterium]|nr:acylase [Saprospiraceae bacterium]MCF8252169.1 acylase [Saprospiraceae bacterium]MCF8281578.1 acylase [Bacteroidales bacterium]MCF8313838.1 acylase [Saprospiraceae bacterium]MCF8442570.1 acylase [Saprospiraceae bacterium]
MKQAIFLLLLAMTACKTTDLDSWQAQADRVTIIRDDFGVPHIYGKTDADAVFGLLFAQCEDDFNRVEQNYIWAIGRLAEVEGEDLLYSDLRAHLFMTEEEAKANYEKSPDWLKKLCDAFADGVNFYLHSHPEVKPKLLTHFEPWYPMYFSEGSIGGDIEQISTERIKAFYEDKEGLGSTDSPRNTDWQSVLSQSAEGVALGSAGSTDWQSVLQEPRGSNGFAISGKLTASGHAMLLINPHTSFYFRPEVHVVSMEGLNAYGAVTWGQFFVYQGFNEKTGWMHTSSYADVMDEFLETVSEEKGQYFYQYGKEKRPVIAKQVVLKYKDGNETKERKFPIYRTHHGPVTHMLGDKWVSTAMMWDPVKALTQSFTRTKQSGNKGFREMMDIRTNSSNNTVYADAEGNIAYYHGNFIPKRDTAFDFSKPVDGSNPATDWQGLHDVNDCIVALNPPNGWLQNCNSTPFTCAGANSPKPADYPVYMRLPAENFRGIHAVRLLEKGSGYTIDKLIETAYDPYLPGFEKLIPGLVKAFDDTPLTGGQGAGAIAPAIEVLRKWDFRTSTESVAMSLAFYYGSLYDKKGEAPEGFTGMERINYFGTGSPPAERLAIFKEAVAQLTVDFGKWDVPWGEINRFQRLTGDIEQPFDDSKPSLPCGLASGRWGALASFGARQYNGSKRIYGTSGNSFVAVVEFGEKVKAKTLLAGGESGDPKSPHFYDQAQRYVDAKFKDVAYYRKDVEKRAERTYHPGAR